MPAEKVSAVASKNIRFIRSSFVHEGRTRCAACYQGTLTTRAIWTPHRMPPGSGGGDCAAAPQLVPDDGAPRCQRRDQPPIGWLVSLGLVPLLAAPPLLRTGVILEIDLRFKGPTRPQLRPPKPQFTTKVRQFWLQNPDWSDFGQKSTPPPGASPRLPLPKAQAARESAKPVRQLFPGWPAILAVRPPSNPR